MASEWLLFNLSGKAYGIPVDELREIVSAGPTIRVPFMPGYYRGVMSLRGQIVPLVDLGMLLGREPVSAPERAVLMLGTPPLGMLVDGIEKLVTLEMEPPQAEDSLSAGSARWEGRPVHGLRVGELVSRALPMKGAR